jgi:FixJ family two-component response regulator
MIMLQSLGEGDVASVPHSHGQTFQSSAVFVIDDDPAIRRLVSSILSSQGIRVEGFETGKAFLDACGADQRGCILLDVNLPEMSGVDVQKQLGERNIQLPVVFLTGVADVDTSVTVMKRGAFDLIQKPFQKERLIEVVNQAIALDAKLTAIRRRQMIARSRYQTLNARERDVMASWI